MHLLFEYSCDGHAVVFKGNISVQDGHKIYIEYDVDFDGVSCVKLSARNILCSQAEREYRMKIANKIFKSLQSLEKENKSYKPNKSSKTLCTTCATYKTDKKVMFSDRKTVIEYSNDHPLRRSFSLSSLFNVGNGSFFSDAIEKWTNS